MFFIWSYILLLCLHYLVFWVSNVYLLYYWFYFLQVNFTTYCNLLQAEILFLNLEFHVLFIFINFMRSLCFLAYPLRYWLSPRSSLFLSHKAISSCNLYTCKINQAANLLSLFRSWEVVWNRPFCFAAVCLQKHQRYIGALRIYEYVETYTNHQLHYSMESQFGKYCLNMLKLFFSAHNL